MKKLTIYLIVFLIPFFSYSQSVKKEKFNVIYNNSNKIIELYNLNNKYYVSINQLSYLFKNKTYIINNFNIDFGFASFTFLPYSYFAKVSVNKETKIQQYNLTVLKYNNEVLIPMYSFFYSLDSLNIFKTKIESNQITLEHFPRVANNKNKNTKPAPIGYKIPKSVERPTVDELLKEK